MLLSTRRPEPLTGGNRPPELVEICALDRSGFITNSPRPQQLAALWLMRRFGVPARRAALLAELAHLGGRPG